MFYSKTAILATATALVATVGADYYIDPNSVDINTRSELHFAKNICILSKILTNYKQKVGARVRPKHALTFAVTWEPVEHQ